MIWWIIAAVVVIYLLGGGTSKQRPSSAARSCDNWDVWRKMRDRADRIKGDLGTMIWKHGDDEAYWDRILLKYEAWMTQEEEAAKIPCIGNDGHAAYAESDTLFYILGRRGCREDAESYIQRLTRLHHHDPRGKWESALALIKRENQSQAGRYTRATRKRVKP